MLLFYFLKKGSNEALSWANEKREGRVAVRNIHSLDVRGRGRKKNWLGKCCNIDGGEELLGGR